MNKVKFYKKNGNKKISCPENEAEYAMIPLAEYHGYLNALRIIRDRALQQIEMAKADEHGYSLSRGELREYSKKNNLKAWLISKSTPHSIKIAPGTAKFLIEKDLRDFYNLVEMPTLKEEFYGLTQDTKVEIDTFLAAVQSLRENPDTYVPSTDFDKSLKKFIEYYNGKMIFEIKKISANYARGCYDVEYWATDFF